MNNETYLKHPCRMLSVPIWKTKQPSYQALLQHVSVYHMNEPLPDTLATHPYDKYFRIHHDLIDVSEPKTMNGFEIVTPTLEEIRTHINECYNEISITLEQVNALTKQPVYNQNLWVALKHRDTNEIVASGIADFDAEVGEGVLEWIQVSPSMRGQGLGSVIVETLLHRLQDLASFVTVSGQVDNPTNPEALYRRCGFLGDDVWYVFKHAEM